jgi:asparagine synthase (glutamine-hydrolysing)
MGHSNKFAATADQLERVALALRTHDPESMYRCIVSNWHVPTGLVNGVDEVSLIPLRSTEKNPFSDVIQRLMFMDFCGYLPDDILVKVDRASMGVSLESRAPFLDHKVVEFAWRTPPSLLFRNGQRKWILRNILRKHLPPHLIDERKKGFAIPTSAWLRGPLRGWTQDMLDPERVHRDGYFAPALVQSIMKDHLSGVRNRARLLWNLLMFQAWITHNASLSCRTSNVVEHQ